MMREAFLTGMPAGRKKKFPGKLLAESRRIMYDQKRLPGVPAGAVFPEKPGRRRMEEE